MSMTQHRPKESSDSLHDASAPRTRTRQTTSRPLNVRLLAISVVVLAVLGGAAYLWRNHQVEQLATSLLDRVDRLEEDKEWAKAVSYLQQYLQLKPEADEIHVRAAKLFDNDLQTPRQRDQATRLYYRALGVAPDDVELRRSLVQVLFDLDRRSQAETEAKTLLANKSAQDDPTAQRVIALIAAQEAQVRDNVESATAAHLALKTANEADPGNVDVARSRAVLYRTRSEKLNLTPHHAAVEADKAIDKMVEAAPDQALNWLARAQYRQAFRLPGVRDDMEQALKLDSKNAAVLVVAGQYFLSAAAPDGDTKRAQKLFEQLAEVAPARDIGNYWLGRAHKARGDNVAAIDAWKAGRKQNGESFDAICVSMFEVYLADRKLPLARDVLKYLQDRAEERSLYLPTNNRIRQRLTLTRLEAQWLLANNEPSRVVPLVTSALVASSSLGTSPSANPDYDPCHVLLAQAYGALNEWEDAATAYSEIASRSEKPWEAAMFAAEAWKNAGQTDKAIESYRQVAENPKAPQQLWLGMGQMQLQQQVRKPAEQRDWKPFLETLATAKQQLPGAWTVRLLEVDYLLAQQNDADRQRAEALLRAGEKEHATEPQYWQRLIVAYERFKKPEEADRALRKYATLEKNAVDVALVRINLLAARKQFAEAEKVLASTITEAPAPLKKALAFRQMQLALQAGDLASARKQLADLRTGDPSNLRLLRSAAELAFEARDWKELAELEAPLRKAEGDNGISWRFYRAAHLAADPARAAKRDFAESEQLLAAVLKERPRWVQATMLLGQIAEARGDAAGAVAKYTDAIEAGDRRIASYERLIGLLYRTNQFAEAQQVLEKMGRGVLASDRLESLAMAVAVQQDQRDQAVELARRSLAERPEDAMRHIWLAEMLQLTEKREEAIATLQRAVKLAPTDVRPWNAVFMYHLRGKDTAKAERTLTEMVKQVKLEPPQKEFVLAQGYELLGKRPEALAHYRKAGELAPKDIAILSRLAAVSLNDDVAAAEETLRKIVALAPTNTRARQALATLLALRDGDGAWEEAQELLRQASADGAPLAADDRLRAVLLVRRGGDKQKRIAHHAEARAILEGRVADKNAALAADRLLLAGVYESEARLLEDESKLKAARDQLWIQVDAAEPSESHLGLAADFALRHSRPKSDKPSLVLSDELRASLLNDARACVGRIEDLERTAKRYPTARTLSLRARLMQSEDQSDKIAAHIEPLAEQRSKDITKDTEKDQWILEVGNVYTSASLHDAAERWYRRLWPRNPKAYGPLIQSLAAQNRFGEVIKVCETVAKTESSSRPAQLLASVLASGKPSKEDLAAADPIIAKALKDHATDTDLLFAAAVLRTVQGRPLEAIALFEAVVKASPKHLLALNNVATLLAEQPNRQKDALRYIEQAIAVAGRKPALLDTQGTIHLMQGDLQAAVKCLEEAVNSEAIDPRYAFHLAAAYAKSDRLPDARVAFEKAKQNGLDDYVLTEGDIALRTMLEKTL
jgi:tetratricopeptide (TPR) repeat protein